MVGRDLPSAHIAVDRKPLSGVSTRIGHLGGYDLTIATTIGPLAIDVQTSVLGGPNSRTVVSHLVQTSGGADVRVDVVESGGLSGATARSRRLLDHYVQVQAALELATGCDVRIELHDAALGVALY